MDQIMRHTGDASHFHVVCNHLFADKARNVSAQTVTGQMYTFRRQTATLHEILNQMSQCQPDRSCGCDTFRVNVKIRVGGPIYDEHVGRRFGKKHQIFESLRGFGIIVKIIMID